MWLLSKLRCPVIGTFFHVLKYVTIATSYVHNKSTKEQILFTFPTRMYITLSIMYAKFDGSTFIVTKYFKL